jgi:hypothetical protein
MRANAANYSAETSMDRFCALAGEAGVRGVESGAVPTPLVQ